MILNTDDDYADQYLAIAEGRDSALKGDRVARLFFGVIGDVKGSRSSPVLPPSGQLPPHDGDSLATKSDPLSAYPYSNDAASGGHLMTNKLIFAQSIAPVRSE